MNHLIAQAVIFGAIDDGESALSIMVANITMGIMSTFVLLTLVREPGSLIRQQS